MALKYSRQRAVILDFMKGRTDHPTADDVYTNVRKTLPSISLGTVYRNLMLLTELGEICKVQVGDGVDHFDPVVSEHSHFVCSCCGSVSDVPCADVPDMDRINASFDGRITGYTLLFRGTCPSCLNAEKAG